ncbi:MAG: hypothetical protein H9535_04305 [Ignavibacteria bacterium]|nr:hypothetical protein [Ignavibacteria bacterium]
MYHKLFLHRTICIYYLILFAFVLPHNVLSKSFDNNNSQKKQKYLAEVCKIWGVAKYTHPSFIYKYTYAQWDSVLISVISKINVAETQQEYKNALSFLVSALEDKYSYLSDKKSVISGKLGNNESDISITKGHTAIIHISDYSIFTNDSLFQSFASKVAYTCRSAKNIVIDIRASFPFADVHNAALQAMSAKIPILFATIVGDDIVLPPEIYRIHRGYESQPAKLGISSVFFSTSVFYPRKHIPPLVKRLKNIPITILINDYCPPIEHLLHTLQRDFHCVVLHETSRTSNVSPFGNAGRQLYFSCFDSTRISLRTSEFIDSRSNRSVLRFIPDSTIIEMARASLPDDILIKTALTIMDSKKFKHFLMQRKSIVQPLQFQKPQEEPYIAMNYPSEDYRLLALFRLWNVIQYFYPYKHLMDKNWNDVLVEMIPRFQECRNAEEYQMLIRKLAVYLQDSHAQVSQSLRFYMPVITKIVEGQCVVTGLMHDSVQSLHKGDIITSINGKSIEEMKNQLRFQISASTSQAFNNYFCTEIIAGKPNTVGQLGIKTNQGVSKTIDIPYTEHPNKLSMVLKPKQIQAGEYSLIAENIGYIDATRITNDQIGYMFETFRNVEGLVIDLRGYPNGIFNNLASYLIDSSRAVAQGRIPSLSSMNFSFDTISHDSVSVIRLIPRSHFGNSAPTPSIKKIVVLIDERTLSQGEHTCLFLEHTGAVFVGEPTNGTNGNITSTVLPGDIRFWFTGLEIRHADGRQLQRIGILPNVETRPTIAGIRAGRDEVLEKGVEVLRAMINTKK